ncbi:MAG: hypothetical protein ACYDC6_14255 [Acidobacteriaceae bacterium]
METIYIDIDQDYDRFFESKTWMHIKENLKMILDSRKMNYGFREIYIRKSSRGHVHLRFDLNSKMSIVDHFIFRSLMHDDPWRLAIDLRRYYTQGERGINRLFDTKIKDDITYKVGDWSKIMDVGK